MTRDEVIEKVLKILEDEFEIENPGLDDNLTEEHEFDSIDAISMLEYIEEMINSELTQDEKKQAMEIRTINHICDYILEILKTR